MMIQLRQIQHNTLMGFTLHTLITRPNRNLLIFFLFVCFAWGGNVLTYQGLVFFNLLKFLLLKKKMDTNVFIFDNQAFIVTV